MNGDPCREALEEFRELVLGYLAEADQRRVAFLETGDAEELHKYRVGVRRARAALAVGKGWISERALAGCRRGLAKAMRSSNRLRDLDVKGVDFKKMAKRLPESLAPGLEKCLEVIGEERDREFHNVQKILKGKEMILFIEGFKLSPASVGHVIARRGLRGVVRKRVAKLADRIMRLSRELTPDLKEECWHRIRIECKKVRYLIEIFGGYFPGGREMLRPLVRIQEVLGELNDNAMQVVFLRDPIWRKAAAGDVGLAMCLGGLAVLLELRGEELRRRASRELVRFRKVGTALLKGVK